MIPPNAHLITRLRRSRLYILLAPALVVIAISLPGINQGDFRTDSHIYVAVILEMLRSGDWIHPMQGNVPYHNKPPLAFWLIAPFVATLGPTLIAVRLGMILIAALCASALTGLCKELVSTKVALTAGLVFALTHEVFRYTHAFSLDLLLMLFLILCVWAVVHAAGLRSAALPSPRWIILGGIPLGLSLLVKPLLGLLIVPILILWLILVKRAKLVPAIAAMVTLALLIALPWHLEMIRAYPQSSQTPFIDTYILSQSIDRLSSNSTHVTEPIWYYPIELTQSYIPWIVFLVGGLISIALRRKSITGSRQADTLALLWMVFWIGTLSLSGGKSMRYIVPAYPALALLVAGALVHMPPRGQLTPIILPLFIVPLALIAALSPIKIHSPPIESRSALFAYLDEYSGGENNWPKIWIAPDQLRTAAHFSIHRGFHPHVAISPNTPTGGSPKANELMLYRTQSHYIPRQGDTVLAEFGVWIVTRLETDWAGQYTTQ